MILAVDLGSTSFKAGVFDAGLRCIGQGAERLTHRFDSGGKVEFEVDEAVVCFQKAVAAALNAAGISASEISAIGFTSQAQTFTILDPAGRALLPFISWQDMRAGAACDALKADARLWEFGNHSSFGELLTALQFVQLRHIRDTNPGKLAESNRVMHLPSYLVWRLTGAHVVDENLAAMSGLYSLPQHAWWPVALELAGVKADQFSTVVPTGGVAGTTGDTAKLLGFPAGIPVVLAGNDQTAGAFAAGVHDDNALLITLGTAQVAYAVDRSVARPSPSRVRGPYPGGRFYRMGADSCGGSVVNWAETVLVGCDTDAGFFAAAAKSPPGCRGLVFDADVPAGQGSWRHLGLHHQAGDMARAVVESLCRRMVALVHDLDLPATPGRVLVAGGGRLAPVWRESLGAALGLRIAVTDATPLAGAAALANQAVHSKRDRR